MEVQLLNQWQFSYSFLFRFFEITLNDNVLPDKEMQNVTTGHASYVEYFN